MSRFDRRPPVPTLSHPHFSSSRSVATVTSELTRRLWTSAPAQRPFRVCSHDRTSRKGVMAGTLRELIDKALDVLLMAGAVSVVLDEDGTAVDSEEFFQHLDDDTAFMVLQKGQRWWAPKRGMVTYSLAQKPRNAKDIARITFDIYKLSPRDLFGSLNVRATFYGLYSMTFDVKCLGPKKVIREMLRVTSSLMFAIGQILVTASAFVRRLVEGTDRITECYD
ncbi:lipid transferase CIDEB-like [Hemiscyllium ocellatum]|uniref:lipid transferase CIDEB-like n=1 Tax=Hemiscyllium ocellatum TaxID=170820 RepID=UPI002965EB67|nr:lipid transferase CIDEB-like [Hemiscyllium ocellatum]